MLHQKRLWVSSGDDIHVCKMFSQYLHVLLMMIRHLATVDPLFMSLTVTQMHDKWHTPGVYMRSIHSLDKNKTSLHATGLKTLFCPPANKQTLAWRVRHTYILPYLRLGLRCLVCSKNLIIGLELCMHFSFNTCMLHVPSRSSRLI
jgi:hypothetical protein